MFNTSKQNPNVWILAILIISSILFVVACGGSEPPPPTSAPTPTPGPPTATPTPEPPAATPTPSAGDHIKQGMEYYKQRVFDKAIVEFNEAIKLEPDNPHAPRNLGTVYIDQGKWEEAAAAYKQAIKVYPKFGEAYGDLAAAYVRLDKLLEAIEAGQKAIELAPDYATGHNNLGSAYRLQGQLEQAVAEYQEAIRLDPDFSNPHYSLGLISYSQGQVEEAIVEWEEAARLNPNHPVTHKNLGIGYAELDQPAKALTEFEIYLQLAPDAADRAVIEGDMAKLTARIAAASNEAAGQDSQADAESALMDIDINGAPGNSISFEGSLEPGGAHRFFFMANPEATVGVSITSTSDILISIQDAETGQVLGAAPSDDNSLLVTIPQHGQYHIVIEDAVGQGGDYTAAFVASPEVAFALDPNYFIIGRLPESEWGLFYLYNAPEGTTLRGNVIPHPDTPVDLAVEIRDRQSLDTLLEADQAGPGENEQFTFTIPAGSSDKLLLPNMPYYAVGVRSARGDKGTYILETTSDPPAADAPPVASPESVVQTIFDAAQSGDFAALKTLCDPLGENDTDTQMICELATDETNREKFVQYFASGRISRSAKIKLNQAGGQAEVPVLVGPDGDNEETMELINRDGRWYLYGF
ncbi:MAG: tetratricopeptide repeat protein [Chloroflexota bacterium]